MLQVTEQRPMNNEYANSYSTKVKLNSLLSFMTPEKNLELTSSIVGHKH